MTDIVERLKSCRRLGWDWDIITDAIDEIERLRKENEELRGQIEALDDVVANLACDYRRDFLEEASRQFAEAADEDESVNWRG